MVRECLFLFRQYTPPGKRSNFHSFGPNRSTFNVFAAMVIPL
jgi:hypothetical protein